MKTSRQDVTKNKKQTLCRNSTLLGYSTNVLRTGDLFVYNEPRYTAGKPKSLTVFPILGRCHGQIKPKKALGKEKIQWYILAQVADKSMTTTFERWIEPKDVTEIIPQIYANKHILDFFEDNYNVNHKEKTR